MILFCPSRLGLAFLAVLFLGIPPSVHSQQDTSTLHATIRGWSERTWLYLLDRGAVEGGRLTDQGMLMRFNAGIDDEYAVDVISIFPGLGDEYAWEQAQNGVRYSAGSINHRALIEEMNVRAGVGLGRGWRVGFKFDKEERPGLDRNLPRFGVEKAWALGVFAFGEGTLEADKPDMDMTIGGGWRDRHGSAQASFTLLDAFSDVIYQGLAVDRAFADTALDFERRPYALRGTGHRQLGRHLRAEIDAGIGLPSTVRAYRQLAPDSGFRQNEGFGMVAGLLEWTTLPQVRLGARATWVRAATNRYPLASGRPEDEFQLVERTTQVGGYLMVQPFPRWRLESWLLRELRPQTKEFPTGAAPNVDYEDRAWRGQALVRYLAPIGLKAEAAFEMDLRDVIRGDGQVPSVEGSVGRRNTRLRLELGWRFGRRFWVEGGYRIDLDGDPGTGHGSFDGAHGRGVVYW